jgi:hypothetical protein
MYADATISSCGNYRYVLRRYWAAKMPSIGIVCLNPSTADAQTDDATVTKCLKLAKFWGYGGIVLVNLFAWRSKDKNEIRRVTDPVGPDNDSTIRTTLAAVDGILAAWGNDGIYLGRSAAVRAILTTLKKSVFCIKLNNTGEPVHPLYQSDRSQLQLMRLA